LIQTRTSRALVFAKKRSKNFRASIQASGIIQPLVLRKMGARYHLIAGERRWRAAQRAGLQRVPRSFAIFPKNKFWN